MLPVAVQLDYCVYPKSHKNCTLLKMIECVLNKGIDMVAIRAVNFSKFISPFLLFTMLNLNIFNQ